MPKDDHLQDKLGWICGHKNSDETHLAPRLTLTNAILPTYNYQTIIISLTLPPSQKLTLKRSWIPNPAGTALPCADPSITVCSFPRTRPVYQTILSRSRDAFVLFLSFRTFSTTDAGEIRGVRVGPIGIAAASVQPICAIGADFLFWPRRYRPVPRPMEMPGKAAEIAARLPIVPELSARRSCR